MDPKPDMMGRQQTQHELWAPAIDLFSRLPEDHRLRRLERVLDLGFVREEVADRYGRNGNCSIDPVMLMKMMLVLFLDDAPSERELLRVIPRRLDYLWLLGFGLDDAAPDHSVLSKARRRWGAEVFERLFARSVEPGVAAGQELLDLARAQSHSEAARRDRRKRPWLGEGSFGRAATPHGFKRARWRGLQRQGIQDQLIATVQNLLIRARRHRVPPLIVLAASFPTADGPSQAVLHLRCLRAVFKLAAATLISASRNPASRPPARFTRS